MRSPALAVGSLWIGFWFGVAVNSVGQYVPGSVMSPALPFEILLLLAVPAVCGFFYGLCVGLDE